MHGCFLFLTLFNCWMSPLKNEKKLVQLQPLRREQCRHPTGREKMGSPTLQTHQDPILLLPWLWFEGGPNPDLVTGGMLVLSTLDHTPGSYVLPVQAIKHVVGCVARVGPVP